jgi:nucleotide-binding universal stress UspA family protein
MGQTARTSRDQSPGRAVDRAATLSATAGTGREAVPRRKGRDMGRIVVGVDGSAHADRALRWAIREAELHGAELELVYAYVIHPRASFGAPDRERAYVAMEELVRRHRSLLEGAEKWITTVVPILVGPAGALIEAGEDPDLITAGSRGLGGFGELAVGATSYRTAAHPSAPVAVIRGGDETASPDGSRPIVVGVDGSRAGGRALRWALDEAALRGVGVAAVHAYMEWTNLGQTTLMTAAQSERLRRQVHDEAVAIVDRALAEVEIPDGVALERVATRGPPAAVLLDEAGADRLLVLGSRGRGALGRMVFGSVSHQSLHQAAGSGRGGALNPAANRSM